MRRGIPDFGIIRDSVCRRLADYGVSLDRNWLALDVPCLCRADAVRQPADLCLRFAEASARRASGDDLLRDAAREKSTFYLIVAAVSLNAFITIGFSAVLIELLKAEGLPPTEAIAFGSSLGIVQVSARAMDFLGGGRWDGITTGLIAGAGLPLSLLLLTVGGGTYWSVAAFILCYGLSSGALAVARATIPLVFYDKAVYAKVAAHISLPLNLISALSPPLLAGLLTGFGSGTVLALAIVLSLIALFILSVLSRLRPQTRVIPAA